MSEHGPDIMPEKPEDREEVEDILQEMDLREVKQVKRVRQEIKDGRMPAEILDDLGGAEEARRVIGETATDDLEEAELDAQDQAHLIAKDAENRVWTEILDLKSGGATGRDIIDHFGGYEELERKIGSKAAAHFKKEADKEKTQ